MSDFSYRIAVADFGSNSIKFGLFDADSSGQLRPVASHRAMIALGDDAFQTGRISEESAHRVEEALRRFAPRFAEADARAAAATSAFRAAENGVEMAERFSETLGVRVEILDGLEEARLLGRGVLETANWDGKAEAVVVDIGGGSGEIIRARPGAPLQVASLALGAIRLREACAPPPDDEPYTKESVAALHAMAKGELRGVAPAAPGGRCFGAGGGFTTLAEAIRGAETRPGNLLSRLELRGFLETLCVTPASDIAMRYRLPLRRARIAFAASVAAWRALVNLRVKRIELSWAGLREGLAAREADRLRQK
ncbi:MAG: hypothetical protein NTW86_11735 [Candidatus Sumerlaeota bacterium]|nr:hypothetical protein [Candidatus Sumerlaeota bacterium]